RVSAAIRRQRSVQRQLTGYYVGTTVAGEEKGKKKKQSSSLRCVAVCLVFPLAVLTGHEAVVMLLMLMV
uniref:Uncharacterized protein n=1 Tax=Oryza brachyantha TaxID=4533 RepID=J3LL47_ORYBR